jgi:hypothetical protein
MIRCLLLVSVLLNFYSQARAQHCGFDFSSIIIIRLEPSGLTQVKKMEAVLANGKRYAMWKNVLPKDGSLPKIRHTASILDSHSYWFADTNYVIAGPLGHKQIIPVIISYTTDRAPDTLQVTPDYIHSLCGPSWAYSKDDAIRARFKPIVLDIYRAREADTIGSPDHALVTDRREYKFDDTLRITPRAGWYLRNAELKTDGSCHAKVVYGAKQKVGTEWKELWPVQMIQNACGPGYTYGFGKMAIRIRPDLKPGIYRLFFENSDREILETSEFEIID